MRTRVLWMLPLICALLFLGGCGGDSGSNSSKADDPSNLLAQVDSEDDLPNCTDKREDSLVVIRDSLSGFRCHNKKWVRYDVVSEKEDDLPNCSKSRDGFVAYVVDDENELYCEEGEWVEENESSSSVAKSSSSVAKESSSSAKSSSSSAKSSSSVASSSSVESSSSVASSSSAKSSSSSVIPSSSSSVIPSGAEGSSSSVASSSSAESSSSEMSSSETSSSSAKEPPAEIKEDGYYKTNCPAGKTCTYAPTKQLNTGITYGEFLDTRDYQVYKTVTIGDQTWMAQNLNYAYTGVPYRYGNDTWNSTSWCYKNAADSCAKYGRLYTWAAAIDSVALAKDADNPQTCGYGKTCNRLTDETLAANPIQGVCPSGWHLPSYAEWNTLFTAVGGTGIAGTKLKTSSGWYGSGNGEDSFGFAVLPAGYRNGSGGFSYVGRHAYFWGSTECNNYDTYYWTFTYSSTGVSSYIDGEYYGRSVRCLRD